MLSSINYLDFIGYLQTIKFIEDLCFDFLFMIDSLTFSSFFIYDYR